MNKRHVLLLTAVLGMASPLASAQSTAPTDAQLRTDKITVETGTYTGPLSSLLAAIARTAGYGLILDTDVDLMQSPASTPTPGAAPASTGRPMVYSFQNKPFNEVWPLLMDVYGLSYEVIQVGGQPVLRVGNAPIQRIVALKNADATEVTNQVKLFFGTPTYTETPQKDAQGNVIGVSRTLADVKIDSATLRVVPDIRSNSVIVRGTNKEVAEVTRILGQLDQPGKAATGTTISTDTQTVQNVYTVKGKQADIMALLAAQYPGLKITPVGQTGQLVITGPQNQLTAATTLLAQVDRPTPAPAAEETTVQRVFQLVNASAEEVKATLEGTLARTLTPSTAPTNVPTTAIDTNGNPVTVMVPNTQAQAAAAAASTPQTPVREGEAVIIADVRTNTLIVRGSPTQVQQVAELIPQLDQVVPTVNVQVRIQEVTETALKSLGMKWNVNVGGFNVSTGADTGLQVAFDPTRSFVGFNLFPTLQALEKQGMTRKVYDGNVTMQSGQRALNLGSNTLNASNNAAASIKSGGRLELNRIGVSGVVSRQIDYGVTIDFFNPQVSPDGTISLRVRGQINSLNTALTAGSLPDLLDFANSEAQSTITFKNGQTVMMSGLLGTTETSNKNGVPFLSSLPGVGAAFGTQGTDKKQTQLLVIVTGSVVR